MWVAFVCVWWSMFRADGGEKYAKASSERRGEDRKAEEDQGSAATERRREGAGSGYRTEWCMGRGRTMIAEWRDGMMEKRTSQPKVDETKRHFRIVPLAST